MENRRFHELLEAHLRTSGYTNYEFARITGINRVNIQRYLAGTRLPDPQIFEAIRRELRLGVREHRELQEAYYRAMDGDDVYFMRCMIRRMLEEAGNICGMEAGIRNLRFSKKPPRQIYYAGGRGSRSLTEPSQQNGISGMPSGKTWSQELEKRIFTSLRRNLCWPDSFRRLSAGRTFCHGTS